MTLGRYLQILAAVGFAAASVGAAEFGVRVEDSFFDPPQLAITVGDTVVWTGFGAQDHTVTSDDQLFNAIVLYDEVFSYTFAQPGTYPYYCENHGNAGGEGMSGIIFVSAVGENGVPATPLNLRPLPGATNQPPTVELQAGAFVDPDAQDFHFASQWLIRRAVDHAVIFDSGADPLNKTNLVVPTGVLGFGSNYSWQVRYQDGRGGWSPYSAPTTFATLVPVAAQGVGLLAHYGNSTGTPFLAVTTNATINFAWGRTRPHRRITADNFVALWEGFVLPAFTERYDFRLEYRGQARVWVNNGLLINESGLCEFSQQRRAGLNLVGGQLAPIRIEYGASAAGALAVLSWASSSQEMEIIPATRLFPATP